MLRQKIGSRNLLFLHFALSLLRFNSSIGTRSAGFDFAVCLPGRKAVIIPEHTDPNRGLVANKRQCHPDYVTIRRYRSPQSS